MFPDPSLAPPALAPYELSYRGLVFGGTVRGAAYQLQSMSIDMPDVVSGDVQRALDQGEFPGVDVLPGADITITQTVQSDGVSLDHAAQQLGGVMAPTGTVEYPLWLQMPSGVYARMCRPRKHNCPLDINRVFAKAITATSMLHSTDPRWYAAPSASQTVGLPVTLGGGLAIPASIPASFGSGSAGGLLTVTNSGTFECRPVLVITGPCLDPTITNLTLPGAPQIGVQILLNPGDQLVIDTDWQSVVLTAAGSSVGSSRRNALSAGTTWWNLPRNLACTLEFNSADTTPVTGTLTVQSASAHVSL